MFEGINLRDVGYKMFWTAVAAALGVAALSVPDLPVVWVPIVAPIFTALTGLVRQKLGETPPTLGPPPG